MRRSLSTASSRLRIVAVIGAVAILLAGARLAQTRLSAPIGSAAASLVADSHASYKKGLLPFLQQYCAECHGDGAHEGDFTYDRYKDLDAVKRDRHVWTKVLKNLKTEAMPPADADRPPAEESRSDTHERRHRVAGS